MSELRAILLKCAILNYVIIIVWFAAFVFAHDWMYGMHTRWFVKLSPEAFDAIHYLGISIYKIGVLLFNVVPLIALYMGRKK